MRDFFLASPKDNQKIHAWSIFYADAEHTIGTLGNFDRVLS